MKQPLRSSKVLLAGFDLAVGPAYIILEREYKTWSSMKWRCNNKKDSRYGGRGITYCEQWEKFDNFYADMGERPEGMTLDRIDNNGNYEPQNCKWSTASEQQLNKRLDRRNKSGKTGVTFNKASGMWQVRIQFHGKMHSLGYFGNIKDAIKTREQAEKRLTVPLRIL